MKNRILFLSIIFITTVLMFFSCTKSTITPVDTAAICYGIFPLENTAATILGKWNIVTDSTFADVGRDNQQIIYAGKTGDYFDFRTDSKLYIKENTKLDTLDYRITSDTTILISAFNITLNGTTETSHIKNLTAHRVTIIAPVVRTPGGLFGRNVNLSR